MTQQQKWKAYQAAKAEKRKTLTNRANSIIRTLINLACEGHSVGNSINYARLFSEYKTIEKTLKNT